MKAAVRAGLPAATALTATLTTFPGAPPARADHLDIHPATGDTGEFTTVSGGCETEDRRVTVTGAARGAGPVTDGWFSVRARIVPGRPGGYRVKTRCVSSGLTQEGLISVREPARRDGRQPAGWAKAGGGGTQGRDLARTVTGLALLLGAMGIGGTALVRSRSRAATRDRR